MNELFPDDGGAFKTYKTVAMNFSLLINERGLQQILSAPAELVMKAYLNMMRQYAPLKKIIDKIMDLFHVDERGRATYDSIEAQRRLGWNSNPKDNSEPEELARKLALGATEVIKDLADLRRTGNWKDQSAMLAALTTGKSRSGLDYEDFLKVAVQLTDPLNVSAQVFVSTSKKYKGEQDISQTYQFFNNRSDSFDANIAEVNQMQARFGDPAMLTD